MRRARHDVARGLLPTLLVFVALTAHAQGNVTRPEWLTRAWQTWWGAGRVILPSEADVAYAHAHGDIDWSRDWAAAVATSLAADPAASDRCALLAAIASNPQAISQGQARSLFVREVEICKKYPPTQQRIQEAAALLFPTPPTRRAQIAEQTTNPQANRYWPAYGIYSPPPRDGWLEADPPGRDYRADVQKAFESEPIVAAHVCRSAKTPPTATLTSRQQQLHAILLEVCAAFPDAKIEAAFVAEKVTESKGWLSGLLNVALDESAAMTAAQRQREADRILAMLPNVTGGSARFQNAVRAFALAPDDIHTVAAVVHYRTEASYSSGAGARPDDVQSWLREQLETRSRVGRDARRWKRGLRNYLAINGDLAHSRSVARELAAATEDEGHTRDVIIEAMLDRAAGSRSSYDRLLSNCPAPDARYLETHGHPSRPERFCEDVIGDVARAVRDATSTPPSAFVAMAVETNRVEPAAMPPQSIASAPAARAEHVLDDEFATAIRHAEERVAPLTRLQRQEQALKLETRSDLGRAIPLESAVYLAFLEPWHDSGPAALLLASTRYGDGPRLRTLAQQLYEERSAHGPDAEDWRRGLRAFFLYSGQYEKARQLANEIATHPAADRDRDVMMAATAEFLAGNHEPFTRSIANCQGVSADAELRWGIKPTKSDYCRGLVVWFASRAIAASGNMTVHAGYQEILREIGRTADDNQIRVFALSTLARIAPDVGDVELRAFLLRPNLDFEARRMALSRLALNAEQKKNWKDAATFLDELLALLYPVIPAFSPDMWARLASEPEGTVRGLTSQGDEYDRRFQVALHSDDFGTARRLIEDALALSAPPAQLRYWLIQLATAQARAGQRAEPLKIIGYIATQPLDQTLTEKLAAARQLLSTPSTPPPEPQRQLTPWDTPARPQRHVPPKPSTTVKT